MYLTKIASLYLFSFIKFMITPFSGPALGLTFLETYLICVSGAATGSLIFFYSADYFMNRSMRKRIEKRKRNMELDIPFKEKKKFTRTNKLIVRLKRSVGIFGITFWGPLFLSIPIGSIIAAKFYGNQKKTFPLILLGLVINGLITTSLAYTLFL